MWTPDPSQIVSREQQEAAARSYKVDAIKAEARRRIEADWPIWHQLNLQAEGGDAFAAMRAEIDAIRERSDAIEQMDPLPDDVGADALWA